MAERIHINWRSIGFKADDDSGKYALHLPLHNGYSVRVVARAVHELNALMLDVHLPDAYVIAGSGEIVIDAPPSIFEIDGTNLHNLIEGAVEQAYQWVADREQEESTSILGWLRELSGSQATAD